MQQVRKRRVFYIAGYDPRGSGAYHRLFSEESQKQAALSGFSLRVGERKRESPLSTTWRAERPADGGSIETTCEFIHWDDIVRRHWHAGYLRLFRLAFSVYWLWLAETRLLRDVFRVAPWTFVTVIAPAVLVFLLPLLAVLAGWGGYAAGRSFPAQSAWLSPSLAAAAFTVVVVVGWWLERFFTLGWLLRTYDFVTRVSRGEEPEMEERIARCAERIAGYIRTADDDEILVVGHSVGANVAVSVMAKALAADPGLAGRKTPVGLLTLGGSIPLQGLMPWSEAFRQDLARVASASELGWVDISARQDIASFALIDPVTGSGVTVDGARQPVMVSGAFEEALTPGTRARAEWDMFRMHFQYLMAGEIDMPNNYFAVTTDGGRFHERFRPDSS